MKQIHDTNAGALPVGYLQDVQTLAKLITGVDNPTTALREALKEPSFLEHFSFTVALACRVDELSEVVNAIPLTLTTVPGPEYTLLVLTTGTLAQWVTLPRNRWLDEIIKRFESLGLGRIFK